MNYTVFMPLNIMYKGHSGTHPNLTASNFIIKPMNFVICTVIMVLIVGFWLKIIM